MRLSIAMCLVLAAMTRPVSAQENAIEVLRAVDHAAFWESFRKAPAHVRYSRTERRTAGAPTALIDVALGRATGSDSVQIAADATDSSDMTALLSSLFPEDPPYLADRYYEDFRYSIHPDTMLLGRLARVIHVSAHPAHGRKQPLQEVRYFIDDDLGEIVALTIRQSTQSLFYSESSTYFIQLRQLPGLDWVPYVVRIATRLKLPLRPAVSLLRIEAFYGYAEP